MERKKVPNIVGVSLDEAKEILEKANIEIEKEKKKIDIFEKSGTVVKVEPKEETSLKKNEKVVLYVSDRKPILIIILLFLLCALFMIVRKGTISTLINTTSPVVESKTHEWTKTGMVVVTKDAKMIDELKNYEYCVTNKKSTIGCNWQITETKNAEIVASGKWYVYFRGIDVRGRRSKVSNREYVNVDNENPVVKKIKEKETENTIKVTIEATDRLSGVNSYFYKIDNQEYVLGTKTHEYKNLEANKEYKISIKVVDKVGNETIVTKNIKTKESNNITKPEEPTTTKETTTKVTTTEEKDEVIPIINLDKVPLKFFYGNKYDLPSYYKFGPKGGEVKCIVDEVEEARDTSKLGIGKHKIVCTAYGNNGINTTVEKEVEVAVEEVEEEENDGWIWLNLHYPANSTKWEWKKLDENEEQSGEDLNWKEYTGPIRVRVEDVDKIIIRYEIDGNEIIISPDGYYVDIEPEKTSVKVGEVTKVKINYSNNVEKVEYRINNGVWQEYTGVFEVGPNTSIEARIRYLIDVYGDEGNLLLQKTKKKTASGYIGELFENVSKPSTPIKPNAPTTDPTDPSVPNTCTTCSCVSGTYEVKIIPTSRYVNNNMPVKVKIEYEDGVTKKEYKIGYDGQWQNYTGEISVNAGTIIYARGSGYKEIDGCTKWVSGSTSTTLSDRTYKVYISSGTTSMDSTQKTTVSISTWRSDNLKNIEYSINGGEWTKYNKAFEVGVNTTIVAKATWEVDGVELVDQDTRTIYENKNGLRTSISTSAKRIGGSDEATVSLTTNYKADKIEYTIDNGASWNEYTKVFGVKGNTTVCAKATKTNTDETVQTSPTVCKYVSEDDLGLVIYASAYAARKNAYVTTTIKTKYNVDTLEYSIDSGVTWNAYEGEKVKVQAGSEILARATYRGKVVSTSLKIDILPEPSVILDGPSITGNPENTLTKSVDIEIKTKEVARDVFYRINRGAWIKYTGIFNVTSNVKIEAYYVRDEDGKTSATSTYYVQNVHVGNKPYVRIDTDPKGYLINGTQDKVKVKISGSNYNTLEYSLDGINYQPYTNEFEVTTSLTVYARATNDVGTTTTQFTIVTVNPPKVWKNLSVKIVANPDSKDLIDKDGNVKLVNETEVSLVYGSDVTSACYKVLTSGSTNLANEPCIPYTGAFKVNKNSTIYAYVQSADGKGTDVKLIDFLTLGIASPVIKVDQTSATSLVKISIDYARSASIKKYKIDNGSWIDYTGEIEVTANCTIEAMNEDMVGNQASSTRVISNIVKKPQYNILDKGDYYLIKLNYPSNSIQSSREYKWLTNGTWKKYDEHGILLIKPSAASKIVTPDGVKIKDDKGNEVILTDHYYILTIDLDKVGENLYMRWDKQKVEAPKIIVSEEEETVTSVDVAVSYNKALVSKQYRVIYDNGTDTGWLKYNGKFKVTDKGIVYAKGIDIDGNDSKVAEQRIDNIDSTGPVITITGDMTTPKRKVTLLISAKDDGEVDSLLYEVGSKKADYFKKNGKGLKNPSTITIEENGKYTFYAVDGLGNETIKEIEITNIDKTAPNIEINVLSKTVGTSTEVEINYGDSITTQYKVGETGTYQSYTGKFTLSSYDLFNLKNEDGSLTIYAKGIDQAGNEEEVKEITYVLDLNEFATPIINASDGYPMLTSTGMILGRPTYITYDATTTDVTNYYSIDNGVTWKEYTGGITLVSGEIIAKSVRESTGLEFTSTGKVTIPTNAVGKDTYDNNLQTSETINRNSNKMFTVNNNLYGEKIKVYTGNTVSNTSTIKMYDKNKTLLSTTETVGVLTIVEIPESTYYVEINAGSQNLEVREIELQGSRKLIGEYTPIISINEGGWAAEKVATITYYNEEYENEYSLDNGASWKPYEGPIKLIEPTNVIARTTRENKVIGSSNFIVTKIDPTEPVIELNIPKTLLIGYDQKVPTYYKETLSGTTVECKAGNTVITNLNELEEGEHKIICTAKTGTGKKATVEKDIKVIDVSDGLEGNSILEIISNEDIPTGRYSIKVKDETYPVHMITLDGNQHFTENKTFGDAYDVATSSTYAQNMVIVKVNGDLTIDEGVTVGPYYDKSYGGPKGFTLYVTGKLTNKGTIDNSHGAKAVGQNVYLWKNTDGTYEYVPAVGGKSDTNGTGRETGGGLSGGSTCTKYGCGSSGFGSAGTSYSGGTGGGGIGWREGSAGNGSPNGGAGGVAGTNGSAGAGNPSGGTGGLLIIYADEYKNDGKISANGADSEKYGTRGGSSGGGSINIFVNQQFTVDKLGIVPELIYDEVKGYTSNATNGTINLGKIKNGQYYDLKEIINQANEEYRKNITIQGYSILSILENENLNSGYYCFIVNNEKYQVHMITLDGNQHFTENKTFGDAYDVGTASTYAQNMVIVKVNGDLEIDSGVTVTPYYNEYGGPKGFTLYVTGKLTNKGTIDNSHGSKAEGQNVYLWKNTDGSYEYVPAIGGVGGKSIGSSSITYANSGVDGVGRQTGGGGVSSGYNTGTGGTGTSYSGGTGSSASNGSKSDGSNDGSSGGSSTESDTNYGSGAGNPSGLAAVRGENGTGGLLTIYADNFDNKGDLLACGYLGGKGDRYAGGSSGGGSINIFTNNSIELANPKSISDFYDITLGNAFVNGGSRIETISNGYVYSGAGGNGTINIGKIINNTYVDFREYLKNEIKNITVGKEISGSSILEIINSNKLENGYYTFVVNEEKYKIHLYSYENSQHWSENMTFGSGFDIGDNNFYAQSMVVVKVNGDLEIDKGVIVSPYYTEYGGPKGFTVYVTGKLTNNGVIDNSHGAYAEGQNVYLWKNTDGTYEYVPAIGGKGAAQRNDSANSPGYTGGNGSGRQTGGGGSGGYYNNGASGSGSFGTSYSGGSGGGGKDFYNSTDAMQNGGSGGSLIITDIVPSSSTAGGGAGNPGGIGNPNPANNGKNGTGGLLVISASKYINNGTISAHGSMGGTGYAGGGSSGGGSINIFTMFDITEKGQVDVSGGASSTTGVARGGIGGNGTISYNKIDHVVISPIHLYPNLSKFDVECEKYEIVINYDTTIMKRLYSLDNGVTWLEYMDSFEIDKETTILAKGINIDGIETDIVTFKVVLKDGIPYQVFDKSNAVLEINKDYIFTVSEDIIGKNLRFYLGSEPSSDATIKIYDKDKKELLSTTFVNNLTVINIPTNAYKFIINAGSKELTINEINIRKELEKNEIIPSISINDVNWTSSKTIEITYPEGYKNEYSLDLGTTWNEYTEPITVETDTTIFTRVVKDEKVVGSSSFVVTTVDNEEPTIEIDIPSEFDETIYYKLPTSYSVGVSGGTSNCYISDDVIKDTEKLSPGIYTIKCEVTNGAGITKSIEKNITVKKARFLREAILQNGVIESIPTLTASSNKTDEKSGVYKSTETNSGNPTYYFRGNVENNNLNFAGYNWKIVRVNEDGTIRIVMNDGINNNAKYKYDSSAFDFYYTGSGNLVKSPLENWYNSNIGNNSNYSLNVVTGDYFCEQAIVAYKQYFADGYKTYNTTSKTSSMVAYDSYQARFKCQNDKNRHGIVSSSVGLLSYDEVLYAGGYPTRSNESYYLYSGVEYRLMSPSGNYPTLSFCYTWTVGNDGKLTIEDVKNAALILRPVINLKVNTRILDSGTGTSTDPYVVK